MAAQIDELSALITAELSKYGAGVTDVVKRCVTDVAKDCKAGIQNDSPVKTGRYKKGWKVKTEYEDAFKKSCRVYNSKRPQLTHLLEFGHAKRGGGRTKAYPHIKKNEQKAQADLPKRIEEAIKHV